MNSIDSAIRQIIEVYRSCDSYCDSGTATIIRSTEGKPLRHVFAKFRTVAMPPKLLKFSFSDESERETVVCGGPRFYCSRLVDPAEITSLPDLVARFHGVSNGAISLVTTLMFPELEGLLKQRITDLPFTDIKAVELYETSCLCLTTADGQSLICDQEFHLIRQAVVALAAEQKVRYDFDVVSMNPCMSADDFLPDSTFPECK